MGRCADVISSCFFFCKKKYHKWLSHNALHPWYTRIDGVQAKCEDDHKRLESQGLLLFQKNVKNPIFKNNTGELYFYFE